MSVSIITPWINHCEFIPEYERAAQGAQVVIVDNGSAPEAAGVLRLMTERLGNNSVYLRNDQNRGFAPANNQGFEHATGDIVLCLNNDIEAAPGWLDYVERDVGEAVIVGPAVRQMETVGELVDVPELRQLVARGLSFPYVEGWCIAARRETWGRLGGWDAETYPKPYCEDADLCWRARRIGVRLLKSHWPVVHLQNGTVREMPEAVESLVPNCVTFCRRVNEWLSSQRAA